MNLEKIVEDVRTLSNEEFAMARRNGIGASDSSAILRAYPGKFGMSEQELLNQKCSTVYTEAEKEISDKPNVRKGSDLEPMILDKAEKKLNRKVKKDFSMYRIKKVPYLTVSFDGLTEDNTPVEAKYCSPYGDKYYDWGKAGEELPKFGSTDVIECAEFYGIPPYYYVQVQHQMIAAESNEAYLAVLRDKDWTLYLFKIPANKDIQEKIKIEGYKFWQKVEISKRSGLS